MGEVRVRESDKKIDPIVALISAVKDRRLARHRRHGRPVFCPRRLGYYASRSICNRGSQTGQRRGSCARRIRSVLSRPCVRARQFSARHCKTRRIAPISLLMAIYSGEERAGRGRATGFRGPAKGPAGVQWANPLSSWFLPGDIRMLAGEARNIASDRAGFLGSHP